MNNKKEQRKREAISLGDGIGSYLDDLKVSRMRAVGRSLGIAGEKRGGKVPASQAAKKSMNLLTCWQKVAPPRMLEHTDNVVYATKSKDTEILVFVDTSAYAAEMTLDKELYRLKLQEVLGKEIGNIKFLVSRKTSLRKKKED